MNARHCGCGNDNDPWRRYCGCCGAALGSGCASCGFLNATTDRFCGGCGGTCRPSARREPPPIQRTIPIDLSEVISDKPVA